MTKFVLLNIYKPYFPSMKAAEDNLAAMKNYGVL